MRPLPLIPVLVTLCAALVVIGSIGPWVKVWVLTVNGTDGDGVITMVLGLLAIALTVVRISRSSLPWGTTVAALCLLAAALVGAWDWVNLSDNVADAPIDVAAEVGWGLVLVTIAGAVGFGVAGLEVLRRETPG